MTYRSKILLLLSSVLLLVSCSKKAVYVDESFSSDSPFKLRVTDDVALSCESARRSLLGQGYLIELANSDEVKARKATRGENTFIEMNVVCVPESNGSTVFATGVLSTYDMKKNTSSASVGLSALGSISLPIGQSIDSLVKVSEETIDDKGFYKRFFTAVETQLSEMSVGREPEPAALEPQPDTAEVDIEEPPAKSAIWPELFPEPTPVDAASPDVESGSIPEAGQQEFAVSVDEEVGPGLAAQPGALAEPDPVPPAVTPPASTQEEPMGIDPPVAVEEAPPASEPEPDIHPDEEPLGINPEWSLTPQATDAGQAVPQNDAQSADTELINDLF